MRISDWSSDVCSSDLAVERFGGEQMERGDGGVARADIDPARVERVGEPARARYVARPHGRRQPVRRVVGERSEEHTSELQSLMRISYAVFCLKKKKKKNKIARDTKTLIE